MNLTTKDLTVLTELMDFEQNLYKQCKQNQGNFSDKSFCDLAETIATQHRDNFNQLFTKLS